MSAKFDWQTEEEKWDDQPEPQAPRPRPTFPWRWALLVVFLVAAGAFWTYRQIQTRITAATAAATADVRSSHTLLQQAINNDDAELFNTLLSGRDAGWLQGQRALLDLGLLTDRWPLGLEPQEGAQLVDVRLAPDLTEAEVVVAQTYSEPLAVAALPDCVRSARAVRREQTAEIQLQQTYVYRRGEQRWLFAPPTEAFWGEAETAASRYLKFDYPARDAAIVKRLLDDLDAEVARACATLPVLNCPADLHFTVYFDPDPNSLAEVADPAATLRPPSEVGLRLPTPTIVGLPVDESGYQALLRGYAAHVVAAAITESVGWRCCEHGLFYQALLDWQLAQLGLRPWLLNDAAYAELFRGPVLGVFDMHDLWFRPPARQPVDAPVLQVYSIVDYLLRTTDIHAAATMQRRLSEVATYWNWMQPYVNGETRSDVQRDWLRFTAAQMQTPPPIALPEQNIQMLCSTGDGRIADLLSYDPRTATLTPQITGRSLYFMHPLADDSGLLLQERKRRWWESHVVVWQDGEERPALDNALNATLFRANDNGDNILLYGFDFTRRQTQLRLLEMDTCDSSGCASDTLETVPRWSPDGRRTVLQQDSNKLWLGDADGNRERLIGFGSRPFWVDNETVGYVQWNAAEPGIYVRPLDGKLELAAPFSAFAPLLPEGVTAANLLVRDVVPHPDDPNRLFVLLTIFNRGNVERGALLTLVDRTSGAVSLRYHLPYSLPLFDPIAFSPDGRWLTMRTLARTSERSQLVLHNVDTGETEAWTTYYSAGQPGYDWSADGRWLVRPEQGYLHLSAPGHDYQALIVHDFPSCSFAAWMS